MSRIDWIMEQNLDADSPLDYYDFYDRYCEAFGRVTLETYKRYCRESFSRLVTTCEEDKTKTVYDKDGGMSVSMKSTDIKTEDDLIKYGKIDTEKWEVVELTNEVWGSEKNPNYLIKGKYKLRSGSLTPQEYIDIFNNSIINIKPIKDDRKRETKGKITHLISIPDVHNGKLVDSMYTSKNSMDSDVETTCHLYTRAALHFAKNINPEETKEIVLPFGEDFFNVDNFLMTTTKGTPQHNENVYKMLEYGLISVISVIDELSKIAPVFVPVVTGNHDKITSYLVGLALEQRYRDSEMVVVDTTPYLEKIYQDGQYCFMLIHAERMKPKDLAWRLATNYPKEWASTIYREVYSGHYHQNAVVDEHGVRVSFLPSLSSVSYWEDSKNYMSLREAQMHSFHPEYGRIATSYFTPY